MWCRYAQPRNSAQNSVFGASRPRQQRTQRLHQWKNFAPAPVDAAPVVEHIARAPGVYAAPALRRGAHRTERRSLPPTRFGARQRGEIGADPRLITIMSADSLRAGAGAVQDGDGRLFDEGYFLHSLSSRWHWASGSTAIISCEVISTRPAVL